jgi:hypothetical protein
LKHSRVVLVGAGRRRQGLGPFFANFLEELGAEVVALVGRSEPSLADAQRQVAERIGRQVPVGLDLVEAAQRHGADAAVIAAPPESHLDHLGAALTAGLHVLCEKPLLWWCGDPVGGARELIGRYEEAGLVLMENVQWPQTLPAFFSLHPGATRERPGRFDMLLSPTTDGERMLIDSLSHPLSLLGALRVEGEPSDIVFEAREDLLGVAFTLANTEVRITLRRVPEPPRPAAYEIDGHRAERRIDPRDYRMEFIDGGRSVPLPDPLREQVAAFLLAIHRSDHARDPAIPARLETLGAIVEAYRRFEVDRDGGGG